MGAKCSACCSCCDDWYDIADDAGLNWIKSTKYFSRSEGGGRLTLLAAAASSSEIIVRWRTCGTSRVLSRCIVWIAEQYNFESFRYVQPPPEQNMLSFVGLQPNTLYAVKFCIMENEADPLEECVIVRTKNGPDHSQHIPQCPGLCVKVLRRGGNEYIASVCQIWKTEPPLPNWNPWRNSGAPIAQAGRDQAPIAQAGKDQAPIAQAGGDQATNAAARSDEQATEETPLL